MREIAIACPSCEGKTERGESWEQEIPNSPFKRGFFKRRCTQCNAELLTYRDQEGQEDTIISNKLPPPREMPTGSKIVGDHGNMMINPNQPLAHGSLMVNPAQRP